MPHSAKRVVTGPGALRRPATVLATLAVAGVLIAPTTLRAQGPTAEETSKRTHQVRTGDTLWDLARSYLSDPFLWPEIYRLNATIVDDPHWIYPGETLRIPGEGASGPIAEESAPSDVTVFSSRRPASVAVAPSTTIVGRNERPTVRLGEYWAAPYVERAGGPTGAGRLVRSADVTGIAEQSPRARFQLGDALFVVPPAGHAAAVGDRYLAYTLGPRLEGQGQIVIPTGIVAVEAATEGTAATARLVELFDVVRLSDGLIPLDSAFRPTVERPAAVDGGAMGRVTWIKGAAVVPAVQQYVVLDVAEREELRAGDQVMLLRPAERLQSGVTLPETEIATVQVLRVTPYGASAIVIDQAQPAIRAGTLARVTARMP